MSTDASSEEPTPWILQWSQDFVHPHLAPPQRSNPMHWLTQPEPMHWATFEWDAAEWAHLYAELEKLDLPDADPGALGEEAS